MAPGTSRGPVWTNSGENLVCVVNLGKTLVSLFFAQKVQIQA